MQFSELIEQYDYFILDLWGVLYDGNGAYPCAIESIQYLNEHDKQYVMLSNMPRPNVIAYDKLSSIGFQLNKDHILTSGDFSRYNFINRPYDYLQKAETFYHLGAENNQDLLKDIDINLTENLAETDLIILSLFSKDKPDFAPFEYMFNQAKELEIPMLCVNPDIMAPNGPSYNYTAGFYAAEYEKMGGQVHYYGKPNKSIYEFLFAQYNIPEGAKVLAVGDSLLTDIKGANNTNIDSLLLRCGNHKNDSLEEIISEAEKLDAKPTYICNQFDINDLVYDFPTLKE